MRHDFWLFREGERAYHDYDDLLLRHDAPIRLDESILFYLASTLVWIPILDVRQGNIVKHMEEWSGPIVVNEIGGQILQDVCLGWKQIFACGPSQLKLRGPFRWHWPFQENEHIVKFIPTSSPGEREYLTARLGNQEYSDLDRDGLLQALTTLASFGSQASTGDYFLLHVLI